MIESSATERGPSRSRISSGTPSSPRSWRGPANAAVALVVPEGICPTESVAPFREIVLQHGSGFLFGELLRDGRMLLVETETAESPGPIWARVKVLIPASNG